MLGSAGRAVDNDRIATPGHKPIPKGQLPPSFVHVPTDLLVRLARRAKATRSPVHVVVEEVLQRGLASLDTVSAAAHELEAEWFAHLAMHAPDELDATQRRVLAATYRTRRVWVYPRCTVGDIEEGRGGGEPYLDVEALKRAWPALLRAASREPETRRCGH